MLAIFFVYFFLVTNVHAGDVAKSTTASFDEQAELRKIAESCLGSKDFEELAGYTVRSSFARILASALIRETLITMGLAELRATLNLKPLPPWKHHNSTRPSDSDLASAPTIQAYYDLKEPRSLFRSLDTPYLYEHNLKPAIAFLDKRFPSIRKVFRRRFEEIRETCGEVTDRKAVDRMLEGYFEVHEKVRDAVQEMTPGKDGRCWDD